MSIKKIFLMLAAMSVAFLMPLSGCDKDGVNTDAAVGAMGAGGMVNEALYESDVLALVNEERALETVPSLERETELDAVARGHSEVMRGEGYIFHETGPDGALSDRLQNAGIYCLSVGENVANGYPTPESVMDAWIHSDGHSQNILNPSFTRVGIGLAMPGYYCTQVFIGR